jgi:hypothetical protein
MIVTYPRLAFLASLVFMEVVHSPCNAGLMCVFDKSVLDLSCVSLLVFPASAYSKRHPLFDTLFIFHEYMLVNQNIYNLCKTVGCVAILFITLLPTADFFKVSEVSSILLNFIFADFDKQENVPVSFACEGPAFLISLHEMKKGTDSSTNK